MCVYCMHVWKWICSCMLHTLFAHGAILLLSDVNCSLRMTFGYRCLQLPHQIMPLLMICILHQSTYSSKFYSLLFAVKYPLRNVACMYHEQNVTSAVHVKVLHLLLTRLTCVLGKCTMLGILY